MHVLESETRMKNLLYKIRCFKSETIKNMFTIINNIHNKTKKNRLIMFFDMVFCSIRFGAGPYDYQEFEFYNLNNAERKTYLTRVGNNAIVRRFNKKEDFYKFDDKHELNRIFDKYLHRDWMYLEEDNYDEFVKFCADKEDFFAKPEDGSGGFGIELIKVDPNTLKETYERLLKMNVRLLEEKIIQNEQLALLNKNSVNTLRIVTFFDGQEAHVINVVFKIGNGGITDNFSSGGMYTFIEDGKIVVPAIDRNDNVFEVHPVSGIKLVGYEMPNYDSAIALVKECAKVVPTIQYVGWDVAITPDGACLIEGNAYPGVFQIKPSFLDKKVGLVPRFEKAMGTKIKDL